MKMFESGTNEQAPAATLRPDSPEMSDCEAEGQQASQARKEIDHFRWSLRPVLSFLMLACIQFLALPSASAQTAGKVSGIAEFRILTSNTNAEYGNYSGGLINVVTKSGENNFHGSIFEFLRNTGLDSKGFFSPERSTFQQNQYGGPIKRAKVFFFLDYQGQSTVQGLETGPVSVPSLANRAGDFSDPTHKGAVNLTGSVNGDF